MKPLPLLLAASLLANVLLFAKRAPGNASSSAPASISRSSDVSAASTASDLAAPHAQFWRRLDAGDPAAIEQLRAAGWPAEAIAVLVRAHVFHRFRDEMKSRWPDSDVDRYWDVSSRFGGPPDVRKAQRELWKEYEAKLKKLLGPDAMMNDGDNWRDLRFAHLPPQKAAAVRTLENDYQALLFEAQGNFDPMGANLVLPEDREKIQFLEQERRNDLARILTPEELFDYEARSSQTASNIRLRLAAFDPSEEEFRTLFRIERETRLRLGHIETNDHTSPDAQQRQKQLRSEVDAQIQQTLSPERYADYVRAQDYDYHLLHNLSRRLDLPASAIRTAYDVKAVVEKRINDIRKNTKDPEVRRQEMTAAIEDAEAQIKTALGEHAYAAFAQNRSFVVNWRRSLPPLPKSTP